MVPRANFTVDQGANCSISITLINGNSVPINLTGYTSLSEMRKSSTSSKKFTLNVNISPTIGVVTLSLTGNATANIPEGRYHYDCLLQDALGVRSKVVEGMITVKPGATRWP